MNGLEALALPANIAWLILGAFSVVWVFLGWYLGRRARTVDDYMLAGRNVGLALATATAMATWVTTNTTMAAPQFALQLGIWGMVGYALGSVGLILFAPLAGRIRRLMPGGFTSGDFIRLRYGKTAWRVFLVISLIYGLGWLISLGMAGGVLIGLSRLNRILEVDIPNLRVTVEPGVTNLEITRRVAPMGCYYAPDPSSQSVCSIGGNLGTNAGCLRCMTLGTARQHVLVLEAVRASCDGVRLA